VNPARKPIRAGFSHTQTGESQEARMPLTATVRAGIRAQQTKALDLGTPSYDLSKIVDFALTSGTGAGAADLMFTDTRTVAASGTDALDLAGGLTDAYGTTLTFVELRAVLVAASSANTNNVRINRPSSNGVPLFLAAGDGIDVPPGGVFLWACPADGKVTVTASTGDLLNIDNSSSGSSVTYSVVILGTSA
jgi:hypothetical protein